MPGTRVGVASEYWVGDEGRSGFTYARSVLLAARTAGVDSYPVTQPDSTGARVGGLVLPYLRSQLGGYPSRPDSSTIYHQVSHGARRGVDVATIFDLYPFRDPTSSLARTIRQQLIRACVRRAKRVVTLTEAGAQQIASKFPDAAEKLRPTGFAHEIPAEVDRERPADALDALWVGVLGERKRPEVFAALAVRFPEKRFAMRVGTVGWEPPGRPGNLRLLPRLTPAELDRLYRSSRVIVVTSTVEGFHAPAMEAYLRGARLVLPRVLPFTEIYPGGNGARNVHWYDPEAGPAGAFADALAAGTAENPDPAVVESVSYRHVGERLRAVYEEVAPKSS